MDGSYYDKLMVNCLRISNYSRPKAVKLFIANFPGKEAWMTGYAYKVHDRVMGKFQEGPKVEKMIGNTLINLQRAHNVALERGVETGDFSAFLGITDRIAKVTGMEKKEPINFNQNHLYMSKPPEEVQARIAEIESKIAGRISGGVGGVGSTPAYPPAVDIQATQ